MNTLFTKKYETDIDVVTAARQRIVNIFSNKIPVFMNISGGKDSICLNHLVYSLVMSGKIDKQLLTVVFIDEEGIYPCVERIVKNIRQQWILAGVKFEWYAMQYKHYNCLNQLTSDETFICFDETKKDSWIRNPPQYAIRKHPLLVEGKDNYQRFMDKLAKNCFVIVGVRVAESIQRKQMISQRDDNKVDKIYPIYDWKDSDVWKYIYDNHLDFPDAYIYMYQVGIQKNRLRLSQFFSVDTVGALVKMCQFYPDLFDKICKREPNAYMAMLYYDTELFRRKKKSQNSGKTTEDYKKYVLDCLNNIESQPKTNQESLKTMKKFLLKFNLYYDAKAWKMAYQICVAGDPKGRTVRALNTYIYINRMKGVVNG